MRKDQVIHLVFLFSYISVELALKGATENKKIADTKWMCLLFDSVRKGLAVRQNRLKH